jgi:DNA ligase (NAD+)
VSAPGVDFEDSRAKQMEFLQGLGFETVYNRRVNKDTVKDAVAWFEKEIETYDIPSDGLVLTYDDIAYSESLGRTAKFPRSAIAFKWQDEVAKTHLQYIEWSPSRTGLINPVAVFDSVELEGTTVSRASVHNISVMRSLRLGIGDEILVYKANMIIPQIAENLTGSNSIEIPKICPVCGGDTEIREQNEAQTLYCINPECPVKRVKALSLFVSREALNMDGLSEMTVEKFTERGFIKEYADFFHLDRHKDEIVNLEGFGEKSYENITKAIDASRNTTLGKLLYGLGISGIGVANAKLIARHFDEEIGKCRAAGFEEVSEIEGVGPVIAESYVNYFKNPLRMAELDRLLPELTIAAKQENANASLAGKTFVVTGSLNHFKDRAALKEVIESMGGKVSGSVSAKTECLINNDVTSSSSKNKTAKELGIPILSEDDFLMRYNVPSAL